MASSDPLMHLHITDENRDEAVAAFRESLSGLVKGIETMSDDDVLHAADTVVGSLIRVRKTMEPVFEEMRKSLVRVGAQFRALGQAWADGLAADLRRDLDQHGTP